MYLKIYTLYFKLLNININYLLIIKKKRILWPQIKKIDLLNIIIILIIITIIMILKN